MQWRTPSLCIEHFNIRSCKPLIMHQLKQVDHWQQLCKIPLSWDKLHPTKTGSTTLLQWSCCATLFSSAKWVQKWKRKPQQPDTGRPSESTLTLRSTIPARLQPSVQLPAPSPETINGRVPKRFTSAPAPLLMMDACLASQLCIRLPKVLQRLDSTDSTAELCTAELRSPTEPSI